MCIAGLEIGLLGNYDSEIEFGADKRLNLEYLSTIVISINEKAEGDQPPHLM